MLPRLWQGELFARSFAYKLNCGIYNYLLFLVLLRSHPHLARTLHLLLCWLPSPPLSLLVFCQVHTCFLACSSFTQMFRSLFVRVVMVFLGKRRLPEHVKLCVCLEPSPDSRATRAGPPCCSSHSLVSPAGQNFLQAASLGAARCDFGHVLPRNTWRARSQQDLASGSHKFRMCRHC